MNYIILFLLAGAALAAVADSLNVTESKRISACQKFKQYRNVLPSLEKFWKYLIQQYRCDKKTKKCGLRKKQKMSIGLKIGGGVNAGLWPWQVSIFKSRGLPDCVGTLIADRWVVTAATCIFSSSGSTKLPQGKPIEYGSTGEFPHVRVGDRNLISDDVNEEKIRISKAILHPNFKKRDFDNLDDIALLQLKKKVSFNDHVNVACLPDQHLNLTPGTKCMVLGWGAKVRKVNKTIPIHMQVHFRLQEVEMPLISLRQCKTRLIFSDLKSSMHICAGGDYSKGTRGGDVGSPLLCSQNDNGRKHWYLYGVSSFESGSPGNTYEVFTRVGSYSDWIARMQRLYPN